MEQILRHVATVLEHFLVLLAVHFVLLVFVLLEQYLSLVLHELLQGSVEPHFLGDHESNGAQESRTVASERVVRRVDATDRPPLDVVERLVNAGYLHVVDDGIRQRVVVEGVHLEVAGHYVFAIGFVLWQLSDIDLEVD